MDHRDLERFVLELLGSAECVATEFRLLHVLQKVGDRLLPGVHLFDPDEERQAEMRSLAVAFRARALERLSSR